MRVYLFVHPLLIGALLTGIWFACHVQYTNLKHNFTKEQVKPQAKLHARMHARTDCLPITLLDWSAFATWMAPWKAASPPAIFWEKRILLYALKPTEKNNARFGCLFLNRRPYHSCLFLGAFSLERPHINPGIGHLHSSHIFELMSWQLAGGELFHFSLLSTILSALKKKGGLVLKIPFRYIEQWR